MQLEKELRLLREAASKRHEPALEGISRLKARLENEKDPDFRSHLYRMLISEFWYNRDDITALEWARAMQREFNDVNSQHIVAHALMNCNFFDQALEELQDAFQKSIKEKIFVNLALEFLATAALQLDDLEVLEKAADQFVKLPLDYCTDDLDIKTDWLERARELGLSSEIIAAIYKRADDSK